ncbi:hypothetical protein RI367_006577 [Sorochytrium milnesiophthora]
MTSSNLALENLVREKIIYQAGVDFESRPMLVFCASHLPDPKQYNYDAILSIVLSTLDDFVESDYVVVMFTAAAEHRPGWTWMFKAYNALGRKYKKNLKQLYVVHPVKWLRVMFDTMNRVLSPKFFRKVTYVETLSALSQCVPVPQLRVPEVVVRFNTTVDPAFDMSAIAQSSHASSGQFGVPLDALMGPQCEKGIPLVIKTCTHYILSNDGLAEEGLFRRSPVSQELRSAKQAFNSGSVPPFDQFTMPTHVAASLIKMFFRELPTPLIPSSMYRTLASLTTSEPVERHVAFIQHEVFPQLPPPALPLLAVVCHLLHQVSRKSETNLMTASNLVRVFAPNLVRGDDPLMDVKICGADGGVGALVKLWIEQWEALFKNDYNAIQAAGI